MTIAPYDRGYGLTSADDKPTVSCRNVLVSAVRTLLHTEEVIIDDFLRPVEVTTEQARRRHAPTAREHR